MDKQVLLAGLRAMVDSAPDFDALTPTSRQHHEWLGRSHALIAHYDRHDAVEFKISSTQLSSPLMRDYHVGILLAVLHRAIGALEIEVPVQSAQVFGPGAVYDFLKSLKSLLQSATSELLIVDPYLDDQVFDTYLSTVSRAVTTSMIAHRFANSLKPALLKFNAQNGMMAEIRSSPAIHDRVVFVDRSTCCYWSIAERCGNKKTNVHRTARWRRHATQAC